MIIFRLSPFIIFLGNDIVWWTGILSGFFFLLLLCTAIIKQFNVKGWIKYQIPSTKLHHWFGWLCAGFLLIHFILAILAFNFGILI